MEVILAKSAGFCFGVRRAVNEVYRCLEEEKDTPIYTFGPIIHNDEVVNDLKNKGVQVVDTLESLAALKKGIVIIAPMVLAVTPKQRCVSLACVSLT